MKEKLLEILCCPYCRTSLNLKVLQYDKIYSHIESGSLSCDCGRNFPILKGIPRMLPDNLTMLQEKTQKSFSFQWNAFPHIFKEYRDGFLEYIEPLKEDFFMGKTVLEIGCGFGRHTYFSKEFGARCVVGVDLSEAVLSAYENTKHLPDVHIVQADLYQLPFESHFDFIFCIGVLHHLPEQKKAFSYLISTMKPCSYILFWIYGTGMGYFKTHIVEYIRKYTTKMNYKWLYYLCFLPAAFYHFGLNIPHNIFKKLHIPLYKLFPKQYYAHFPFKVKHADAFDVLSVPLIRYYTFEELKKWTEEYKDIVFTISSMRGKSWRVTGFREKGVEISC